MILLDLTMVNFILFLPTYSSQTCVQFCYEIFSVNYGPFQSYFNSYNLKMNFAIKLTCHLKNALDPGHFTWT